MTRDLPSPLARLLKTVAKVEPAEVKAVVVSFVYFALLMGSYFIVRPVRDAMGTVYGVDNLEELYTGTFVASFLLAPAYAFLASRITLSTFLPWVYGFIAVTMVGVLRAVRDVRRSSRIAGSRRCSSSGSAPSTCSSSRSSGA